MLRVPRQYDETVREGIPGSRWKKDRELWALPLSWASCVVARGLFGDALEVGAKLREWAAEERASRIEPALVLREAHDLPPGWDELFRAVEG